MDDNSVPDLFCPEILSDLEEIENYYIEHLKHQTPCDTLLNHITTDDSQDEPKCEPSLCETWDESWWNNSEPHGLLIADEDSLSPASEEGAAACDSLFNDSTGSLEPLDETASQLLNKIDNCLGCCGDSGSTSSCEVPTVYSDSQVAILNTETNELLSIVPTLIADSLVSISTLADENNQALVSLPQQQQQAESPNSDDHADQSAENATSTLVPDSLDDSGLVTSGRNEIQAADDHIEEDDMVPSGNPQPVAIPTRAANSQVVPNLQMLLRAHKEAGDYDNDDSEQASYLHFHTSNSQSGDAYDSQVVPLWDQEE